MGNGPHGPRSQEGKAGEPAVRASGRALIAVVLVLLVVLPASAALRRTHAVAPGTWSATYDWTAGAGYSGWHTVVSAPAGAYSASAEHDGSGGLWLWPTGGAKYGPGWIEWVYDAPGTSTIASATVAATLSPDLFAHHCVSIRLQTNGRDNATQNFCKPPAHPHAAELAVTDSRRASTSFVFRIEFPACKDGDSESCRKQIPAKDPSRGMSAVARMVRLNLTDGTAPSIALAGPLPALADRYIDGTQAYDYSEIASDDGSGVSRAWMELRPDAPFAHADAACDPAHSTPGLGGAVCPATLTLAGTESTSRLPEGRNVFSAGAQDLAGNAAAADWAVYVDRTDPRVGAAGELLDRHFVDGATSYHVDVSASDPGADTKRASGISRAWIERDGATELATASNGRCTGVICPDSFSPTLTIDSSSFPAGRNTLVAKTSDLVGHVSASDAWIVDVDRAPPTPSVSGALADLANAYTGGARAYDVTLSATDPGAAEHSASGIQSIELLRAGTDAPLVSRPQACSELVCPADASWSGPVDLSALPEGTTTLSVRATDLVGHSAVTGRWSVLLDRTAPPVATNVQIYDRDESARTAAIGWDPSVDPALADGSPASGTIGYSYRTRVSSSSWSAWQTTSDWTASLSNVSTGDAIDVEVRALDGAANVSDVASATLIAESMSPPPVDDAGSPPPDPSGDDLVQPWTDTELTSEQSADALSLAQADTRVAAILATASSSNDEASPWRMDQTPTLLGAVIHFTLAQPTTVEGDWLTIEYDDSEQTFPPYTSVPNHQTLTQVTGVTVYVSLSTKKVVGIEAETNVDQPPPGLRLNARRAALALSASSAGGGRTTSKLRKLCLDVVEFCFFNYDFDGNAEAYGSNRYKHVDMPVTMIWWGGASEYKVDSLLGDSGFLGSLGSNMTARVKNDKPVEWLDRKTPGDKEHRCSFSSKIIHTRVYGDADDGHIDSLKYGFAVIGTTHLDWGECLGHGHSGWSRESEYLIGEWAKNYKHGLVVKSDAVNLYNREGFPLARHVGSHVLWNDGKATTVWMPDGPVFSDGSHLRLLNSVKPAITGAPKKNTVLTADPGTWDATGTPTFSYSWLRCDPAGGTCASTGSTEPTYTVQEADVGYTLRLEVTATIPPVVASVRSLETAVVRGGSACGLSGDTSNAASGAPPNDDFSNASPLSGETGSEAGTLTAATVQNAGEVAETIAGDPSGNDVEDWAMGAHPTRTVWYCWTAPADGQYEFDTKGSPPPFQGDGSYSGVADPPTLIVWLGTRWNVTGTDAAGNPVADYLRAGNSVNSELGFDTQKLLAMENKSNGTYGDAGFSTYTQVTPNVKAGTQILIEVENWPSWPTPDQGDFKLNWSRLGPIDMDYDGITEEADNCPSSNNPGQQDYDGNGRGDACDPPPSVVRVDNNSRYTINAYAVSWFGYGLYDPNYWTFAGQTCAAFATCTFNWGGAAFGYLNLRAEGYDEYGNPIGNQGRRDSSFPGPAYPPYFGDANVVSWTDVAGPAQCARYQTSPYTMRNACVFVPANASIVANVGHFTELAVR
jgi:hypothetical protein